MANVRDGQALDPNSQVPNLSQCNQAVPEPEQGRLFTINHSVQPCIQVPDQLQRELSNATAEQTHNRIEPLSEPLPEASQEVEVIEPCIDPHVTLNEEELSGIVTSDQVRSRTLPDVPVLSGFTPEQERELLSILADIRRQYSPDQSTRGRHHRTRGRPQDAIGVIPGPTVRAEEIFVTPPSTPPSESEDSPQPEQTHAASEKEKKRKSLEPSKATGTKRKYARQAPATGGAGASSSFRVPAQVPDDTQAWVDVPVQELANLTTLADTTTTVAETATVDVQANLAEPVNDVDERVSREAVEKWLEDCRPKE